jgi:cholesterol transport system auxiliary component
VKTAAALALALLLPLPGCALTSKADPLPIRYFTPTWQEAARAAGPASAEGPRLRLGRVSSSSHLRSRIVYRPSAVEVAMYEDRRWTEKPEEYVRRALAQALFEKRAMVQAVSGVGPELEVELLAFDEVHKQSGRAARVTLHYAVQDGRTVLESESMTVEVDVRGDPADPENMAASMGTALHRISEQIASRVASRLKAGGAGDAPASAPPSAVGEVRSPDMAAPKAEPQPSAGR